MPRLLISQAVVFPMVWKWLLSPHQRIKMATRLPLTATRLPLTPTRLPLTATRLPLTATATARASPN